MVFSNVTYVTFSSQPFDGNSLDSLCYSRLVRLDMFNLSRLETPFDPVLRLFHFTVAHKALS